MRPKTPSRMIYHPLFVVLSWACAVIFLPISSHAVLRGEAGTFHPLPKLDLGTMERIIPNPLEDLIDIGHTKRNLSTRNDALTLRRVLNEGDFDELNNVLRVIEILLPDVYFEEDFEGEPLDFWASQIVCSNIQVGDVIVSYETVGDTGFVFKVSVEGVRIDCDLDYRYV
jgi:hypothetical protein